MRLFPRGFSLLEITLGAALTLMFTSIVVYALIPLLRYGNFASARSTLAQAAATALERMASDLQRCPMAAVSLFPTSVGMHPVEGVSDSGQTVFAGQCVLYVSADKSLTRAVATPNGPAPVLFSLPALRTAFDDPATVRYRMLSGIVKGWSLELLHGTALRVHLSTEVGVAGRGLERFELTRDLAFRNRGVY